MLTDPNSQTYKQVQSLIQSHVTVATDAWGRNLKAHDDASDAHLAAITKHNQEENAHPAALKRHNLDADAHSGLALLEKYLPKLTEQQLKDIKDPALKELVQYVTIVQQTSQAARTQAHALSDLITKELTNRGESAAGAAAPKR